MNIFKSIFQHFKIIRNIKNIKDDFIAKKIQMHQLLYELKAFSEDKTEFDFIGICSDGNDCIYFRKNKCNLDIEYEAVTESQIPYYEKIKQFALENSFQTDEKINKGIPYIRISTDTSAEKTFRLAEKIQQDIFGNNDLTQYEIVP